MIDYPFFRGFLFHSSSPHYSFLWRQNIFWATFFTHKLSINSESVSPLTFSGHEHSVSVYICSMGIGNQSMKWISLPPWETFRLYHTRTLTHTHTITHTYTHTHTHIQIFRFPISSLLIFIHFMHVIPYCSSHLFYLVTFCIFCF